MKSPLDSDLRHESARYSEEAFAHLEQMRQMLALEGDFAPDGELALAPKQLEANQMVWRAKIASIEKVVKELETFVDEVNDKLSEAEDALHEADDKLEGATSDGDFLDNLSKSYVDDLGRVLNSVKQAVSALDCTRIDEDSTNDEQCAILGAEIQTLKAKIAYMDAYWAVDKARKHLAACEANFKDARTLFLDTHTTHPVYNVDL